MNTEETIAAIDARLSRLESWFVTDASKTEKPAIFARALAEVARRHQIESHRILGPSREAHVVAARYELIGNLVEHGLCDLEIAKFLGKDRSTISYARATIGKQTVQSEPIGK